MSLLGTVLFPVRLTFILALVSIQLLLLGWFLYSAYEIRLYPIKDFGYIIHEFDPWFNYRATEYLAEHGLSKFFKWYDYMSWYPLGRPVGTTIYPGMQITAVVIWEVMKKLPSFQMPTPKLLLALKPFYAWLRKNGMSYVPKIPSKFVYAPMSVNDICCMIPPWFGSLASLFTGLLTYEISRSVNAGLIATGIMAIIPAHLMRSVGGEFDNEAVAVTAICATFWLWLRSVRTPSSWPFGVLAGIAYVYMVAVWGGYIFVLNMIGVHALMLVGLGRFNSGVWKAYTLFWVIGTLGAIQIPVVGLQPIRSLEQLGPMGVFLGYQALAISDFQRKRASLSTFEHIKFRAGTMMVLLSLIVVISALLYPMGYFGPLSSRIRGLFVKHTKTGNPLVDSVAEHQPANPSMYASYLNLPLDYVQLAALACVWKRSNGAYFLALYGFIAQHFSGKMSRLVLICGPVVSVACAVWCGFLLDHILQPVLLLLGKQGYEPPEGAALQEESAPAPPDSGTKGKEGKEKDKGKKKQQPEKKSAKAATPRSLAQLVPLEEWEEELRPGGASEIKRRLKGLAYGSVSPDAWNAYYSARTFLDRNPLALLVRLGISLAAVWYFVFLSGVPQKITTFVSHCDQVARSLSNPQVVYWGRDRSGNAVKVDDYYVGYQWIDKNTPKDARVMAWWDYGYQITGIAKRTSIADGNTWNHEHIATLGRTLTSPEKRAWSTIRHLADYVLVWAGGGGDDLAKSPHLARIGNSVFPDHCGDDDPKCHKFGFYQDYSPTPMMAKSLLYKLVMHDQKPGVHVDERYFQEVHTTRHGLMRVFKVMNVSEESKAWVANPKNRICDKPGSWICTGQYPPAIEKLIAKRKNFAQLEDFNKKGSKSAYTKLIEEEQKRNSEL